MATDGELITVATFQVSGGDEWTTTFQLPGDPRDFVFCEMSIESPSDSGGRGLILEAPIEV